MANKIIIEFIDDVDAAQMALNAYAMYCALLEISRHLRELDKYVDKTDDQDKFLCDIRDRFADILISRGITL